VVTDRNSPEGTPVQLDGALIIVHTSTGVFVLPNVTGTMRLDPVIAETFGQPTVNGIAGWDLDLQGRGPFYSWTNDQFADFNAHPSMIHKEGGR
jgi:hypothetical protein